MRHPAHRGRRTTTAANAEEVAAQLHTVDMHATVGGVDRSGAFVLSDIRRKDASGDRRV